MKEYECDASLIIAMEGISHRKVYLRLRQEGKQLGEQPPVINKLNEKTNRYTRYAQKLLKP